MFPSLEWMSKMTHSTRLALTAGCWLAPRQGCWIQCLREAFPSRQPQSSWTSYLVTDFLESKHLQRTRQKLRGLLRPSLGSHIMAHLPLSIRPSSRSSPRLKGRRLRTYLLMGGVARTHLEEHRGWETLLQQTLENTVCHSGS